MSVSACDRLVLCLSVGVVRVSVFQIFSASVAMARAAAVVAARCIQAHENGGILGTLCSLLQVLVKMLQWRLL